MGRRRRGAVLLSGLLLAWLAWAGPVEFGFEEVRKAAAERGLNPQLFRFRAEITSSEPESYRVAGRTVSGGDLRGLMYGLLDVAEQIRTTGRVLATSGRPAVPLRGIRQFVHNEDLSAGWFDSEEYWRAYFQMLARCRFNRFNLVFAHQTSYMAPPYPYWVEIEEFPQVRVPGLSRERQRRNLEALCQIARLAAEFGIDFTLGVWQQNVQPGMEPAVDGLSPQILGPYTYRALRKVLQACPEIRSVQVRTNVESGIAYEQQVAFFRDFVFPAIQQAGRLVTLDLRGWQAQPGVVEAAVKTGLPLRVSAKFWAEHLGRPYPPAETFPGYSYGDLLRKPRPWTFFFEIWALGSNRLLVWGDPDYVRQAARTLTLSGAIGFEIDAPLAQKGFGNRPGKWGIFAPGNERRQFWRWEFERYWLFYLLWGRLTYDPEAPEQLWNAQLQQRFGNAAREVLWAYSTASRVLPEILATFMPDPNMYMWPEINPGGLIDFYRGARPGDWRLVASPVEAVDQELQRRASAKQRPEETAEKLQTLARRLEEAIELASKKLGAHREWLGTEPDFRVLALLARYHASKQRAALDLERFYRTSERSWADSALKFAEEAAAVWERLARFTANLYPPTMAFGPEDTGHWQDKLPYVRQDVDTIRERLWVLEQFGQFDYGFDFGGELPPPRRNWEPEAVRSYSVEPRFLPVAPDTLYSEETGYGWLGPGKRSAHPYPAIPRQVLRATAQAPERFPVGVLLGDWIEGDGPQKFRVRCEPGQYEVVFVRPDGRTFRSRPATQDGAIDISFPDEEWRVSALILYKADRKAGGPELQPAAGRAERPQVVHQPPRRAVAGQPLTLQIAVKPATSLASIRLYYRPLNQLVPFRVLEAAGPVASFTIPGEEVPSQYDLQYYFELLDPRGRGWFFPDPEAGMPYFVVETEREPG